MIIIIKKTIDLINQNPNIEWLVQQYQPSHRTLMLRAWTGKEYLAIHCYGVVHMCLPLRLPQSHFEFRESHSNFSRISMQNSEDISSGLVIQSEGKEYYVGCERVDNGDEFYVSPTLPKRKSRSLCGGNVASLLPHLAELVGASMELTYLSISHGAVEFRISKPAVPDKIITFVATKFVDIVPFTTDIFPSVASGADLDILRQRISLTHIKKPLAAEDILVVRSGEQRYYIWGEKCQLYELE